MTNRIELEVRVWSRGEIELTVEGEGRNELTEDRDNRFVRGLEAALARRPRRAARGRRLADLDAQPDPAGARARLVGGGDGRRACSPGNALAGEPLSTPSCCASRPRSRAIPTTRRRRCSAGSSSRRADRGRRVEAIRFDSPRDLRAVLFIPELRLADRRRCAQRCRPPCRWPTRSPTSAPSRSASPGSRPGATSCCARLTVDRLHEPYRADGLPAAPGAWSRPRATAGALGACLSGAGSTILAFADSMAGHHPDRGRVLRRRGGPRPARPGRRSSSRATPGRRIVARA